MLRIGVAWDGRELRALAEQLPLLEIAPAQGKVLSPRVMHGWAREVEDLPHFRFSVKLFSGFTHEERWPQLEVERVQDALEPLLLRRKLDALLAQFPARFEDSPEARRRLMRIARAFSGLGLQFELPHASWRIPALYEWLREHGIGLVIMHPDASILTASNSYARIRRLSKPWVGAVCTLNDRSKAASVVCRRMEDALSLSRLVGQDLTRPAARSRARP